MTLLITLSCLCTVLSLTTAFFVVRERRLQRTQEDLLASVLEAKDNQKDIIFRNMHDQVNPMLRFVMRNIESHRSELIKNRLKPEALDQDIDVLLMALNDIRSCTHEEVPARLKEVGFVKSFEEMFYRLAASNGIDAVFVNNLAPDATERFDSLRELEKHRIGSELLENIMRHSGCSFVKVFVNEVNGAMAIRFLYDGHGLGKVEAEAIMNAGVGTGLKSCQARARLLNAQIIYSTQEEFFSIDFVIGDKWRTR
jgi:signal transduction histidine kinase